MSNNLRFSLLLLIISCILSCENPNPNIDNTGKDELISHEVNHPIDKGQMKYNDLIYVPIYSDIYVNQQNQKSLLSATLSIRNTNYSDTLFVSKIDYFNTEGNLVRSYIKNPISLPPMGTINYVIERDDDTGGSGANFIVALSATKRKIKPLIQAIMIGENGGNQGFAFSTDGYSIKEK